MNNNLYQWHDQRMVEFEMQEVKHAVEQAHLLKEAGLSSGNWLGRAVGALFNLLRRPNHGLQDHRSIEQRS